MRGIRSGLCAASVAALCVMSAAGGGETCQHAAGAASPEIQAAFEKLKTLVGEWELESMQSTDEEHEMQSGNVTYRLTGGGSALAETLFPGTPHEMITMYHLDGPALMLTHYCALGNQPRMRAEQATDANRIEFTFAGASNLRSPQDGHMHDLTLKFVDADHLQAVWTFHEGGENKGVTTLNWKRKQS